jgi:hypothetical protein
VMPLAADFGIDENRTRAAGGRGGKP